MPGSALSLAWREIFGHPWRSLGAVAGLCVAAAASVAGAALTPGAGHDPLASATPEPALLVLGANDAPAMRGSLLATSFDANDVAALQTEIVGIERLAPATSLLTLAATAPSRSHRTLVLGTTPEYFALGGRSLARGRWMTADELAASAPVCVVGPALAAALFGGSDPLQANVRVGTLSCSIIGLLAPAADATSDDLLAMPLSTLQRHVLGAPTISAIFFATRADHLPVVVAHQVDMLIRERRRLGPNAVSDFSVSAVARADEGRAQRLQAALAGAAIAGFLLGALGLVLALHARLEQRRRSPEPEAASGASRGALTLRWMLEAALLASLGGWLGAVLGSCAAMAAKAFGGHVIVLPVRQLLFVLAASPLVGIALGAPLAGVAAERPLRDPPRDDDAEANAGPRENHTAPP